VLRGAADAARLLLLRRARKVFAGAWTFVMGRVDGDERATATARREVAEETGLRVERLYTAGALDAFYDPVMDHVVVVPFFVARTSAGEVRVDAAHDAYRWATFDEAAELLTFSAQRRVLAEVREAFVLRDPEPWRLIAE